MGVDGWIDRYPRMNGNSLQVVERQIFAEGESGGRERGGGLVEPMAVGRVGRGLSRPRLMAYCRPYHAAASGRFCCHAPLQLIWRRRNCPPPSRRPFASALNTYLNLARVIILFRESCRYVFTTDQWCCTGATRCHLRIFLCRSRSWARTGLPGALWPTSRGLSP